MTVNRRYDASYAAEAPEWIPPRAEMDVVLRGDTQPGRGRYQEFEIELKCGPAIFYRYFPFSAYVYVDDRAAAVLEFSKPNDSARVTLEVPADRQFRLAIVSELWFTPGPRQTDRREKALILASMQPGALLPERAPRAAALSASSDYFSQQRVGLVDELPEPIFVVGPYRSGTSILTWALGQHPNIWPLPETHWLPMLGTGAVAGYWIGARPARNYFGICNVPIEEYLAYLGACIDEFARKTTLRRLHRSQFERVHPQQSAAPTFYNEDFELARSLFGRKRRWADGTPENAGHLGLMRRLFPAAKFICTTRNPVDVIASMLHFEKAGGQSAALHDAADMWQRMTKWTLAAARAFGSGVAKFISYEEVTASPEASLVQIFDFLDEPRAPKAADCYENRINSSNLSAEERERLRPDIERYLAKTEIPQLYEAVLELIGGTWEPDPRARAEVDRAHQSFVLQTLKGALPDLQIDAP